MTEVNSQDLGVWQTWGVLFCWTYFLSLSLSSHIKKIGTITDLAPVVVVRLTLSQTKGIAQCLAYRKHSMNYSQSHDQEVGLRWESSLLLAPFPAMRQAGEAGVCPADAGHVPSAGVCRRKSGRGDRVPGSAMLLLLPGLGPAVSPWGGCV